MSREVAFALITLLESSAPTTVEMNEAFARAIGWRAVHESGRGLKSIGWAAPGDCYSYGPDLLNFFDSADAAISAIPEGWRILTIAEIGLGFEKMPTGYEVILYRLLPSGYVEKCVGRAGAICRAICAAILRAREVGNG